MTRAGGPFSPETTAKETTMPYFILDTTGTVANVRAPSIEAVKRVDIDFDDLDVFTQGYIEAMFFTSTGTGDDGDMEDAGFADLAPETLTAIIADCAAFTAAALASDALKRGDRPLWPSLDDETQAGRDFWYTRCGHGCGFWGGDWEEPFAPELDRIARTFSNVDLYRGDDGKLYA